MINGMEIGELHVDCNRRNFEEKNRLFLDGYLYLLIFQTE